MRRTVFSETRSSRATSWMDIMGHKCTSFAMKGQHAAFIRRKPAPENSSSGFFPNAAKSMMIIIQEFSIENR
jgi:hypothetical protein